jgi:hypothetical protein
MRIGIAADHEGFAAQFSGAVRHRRRLSRVALLDDSTQHGEDLSKIRNWKGNTQ